MFEVLAPAKINLGLNVLDKRDDGYHNIESVMHQINLCDRLWMEPHEELVVITNHSQLNGENNNLAVEAAKMILKETGLKKGVKMVLEKLIPLGAGLAGGSSDAAAVIKGMNSIFSLGLSLEEMVDLGIKLGSDVPFCLVGGTALVRGRGELVYPIKTEIGFDLVLVNPGFEVSTKLVYQELDRIEIQKRPDIQRLVWGLEHGERDCIFASMGNVMEEVTYRWHPKLWEIKKRLAEEGAEKVMMSGSGPTVFGVFPDAEKAEKAYWNIKKNHPLVFLCSSFGRSWC